MKNIEEKFYEIYNQKVLPKLETLEPQRKEVIRSLFIKELLLSIPILFFLFFIFKMFVMTFYNDREYLVLLILSFFAFVWPVGLCLMYMISIFRDAKTNFKNLIKKNCMNDFAKSLSLKWAYNKSEKLLPLKKSGIFPGTPKTEYGNTFYGEYNNFKFDIQEIKLLYKNKEKIKTLFKGIAICIPIYKKVSSQTIVTSKFDANIHNSELSIIKMFLFSFGWLLAALIFGIWWWKSLPDDTRLFICIIIAIIYCITYFYIAVITMQEERNLKVNLEYTEFDKNFNLYSENKTEAEKIVTTALIERLQNLQTAFGTKNIKCSFFDDKVMFAISTNKDLFELGNLFVPLTDKRQIETFYKELSSIYNMIDYFKLAEKTGL